MTGVYQRLAEAPALERGFVRTSASMRLALLTLAAVLSGCAPTTREVCLELGTSWCESLWLCVVEHSRASPEFIARYGRSPEACATLWAEACQAAFTCPPTEASRQHCEALTRESTCPGLYAARDECFATCLPGGQ
jgi:hypothetical protein